MTVTKSESGEWLVVQNEVAVAGPFSSMAEAWRWIDRHHGEPISKGEERVDWWWDQRVRTGLMP